jgi:hypothetical protein
MRDELVHCECSKVHIHGRWVSLHTYLEHQARERMSSLQERTTHNTPAGRSDLPLAASLPDNSPNEVQPMQQFNTTNLSSGIHSPLILTNNIGFNNPIDLEDDVGPQSQYSDDQGEVQFLGYVFDKDQEALDTDSDIDERDLGYEEETLRQPQRDLVAFDSIAK